MRPTTARAAVCPTWTSDESQKSRRAVLLTKVRSPLGGDAEAVDTVAPAPVGATGRFGVR